LRDPQKRNDRQKYKNSPGHYSLNPFELDTMNLFQILIVSKGRYFVKDL